MIEPLLPPHLRKSYCILAPNSTHYREVSCVEADCSAYARGWVTRIDERADIGKTQAAYIRAKSGRAFTEEKLPTGEILFRFKPGQRCFATHRKSLERPNFFVVRGGDTRLWTTEPRHMSAQGWVDDFGEHQTKLSDAIKRG
jgi:hypothetical protein